MMDGRNSAGRKISLLNDSGDVAAPAPAPLSTKFQHVHLPPFLQSHSRASSASTTPSLSPQTTPSLVRSSSSDSRTFSTPSPLTPAYNSFEQAAQHHHANQFRDQHQSQHQQHYYLQNSNPYPKKMDDQNASMYPPIPDATSGMPSAYPMPALQSSHQQHPRPSDSPSSEPSRASNASQANQKPQKKNQYPCPMAKQVGCTDFFTTSGHAARHAKKHTGKKDAFCPECNKAFTRKDNMEQHRRTHQNGRGSSRTNDDSKVKKSKAPSKKSSVTASEPMLEAAVEQQLAEQAAAQAQQAVEQAQAQAHAQAQHIASMQADQQMLIPASGPYFLNTMDTGPVPSLPSAMPDISHARPPLHRTSFASSLDYVPPTAPMIDPDTLHYSYPSPGLSNGLNSLALAASEHSRRVSEKSQSRSPSESSDDKTP